jgi:hypothetical protein
MRYRLIQVFVDKVVEEDVELRELLKEVLLEMPEEDVKIILERLVRVEFAEHVPPGVEGYDAWVEPHQQIGGGWVMKINFEVWSYSDKQWRKELLYHELYEIIQRTRRREGIHMLAFYCGELDEEPFECSICHDVTKEFCSIYLEVEVEINPYLIEFESVCREAGIDFENFIICAKCLRECCVGCPYLNSCDKHCRLPNRWLNNLRKLLKLL